jgi:hypothetical protein
MSISSLQAVVSVYGRRLVLAVSVFVAAMWLEGCAGLPPVVTPRMLDFSARGKTLPDLEEGRTVFLVACTRCHALDAPDKFSEAQWRRIVPEMAESSKISQRAEGLLLDYLLSARAQLLAQKAGRDLR